MPDASVPAILADAGSGLGGADTSNTDHITIKNHFPVARIKRIMQADDDVGKVAQVTPVVVCKSLFPRLTRTELTPPSKSARALHDLARHQGRR
jgi:hypothetical protein